MRFTLEGQISLWKGLSQEVLSSNATFNPLQLTWEGILKAADFSKVGSILRALGCWLFPHKTNGETERCCDLSMALELTGHGSASMGFDGVGGTRSASDTQQLALPSHGLG